MRASFIFQMWLLIFLVLAQGAAAILLNIDELVEQLYSKGHRDRGVKTGYYEISTYRNEPGVNDGNEPGVNDDSEPRFNDVNEVGMDNDATVFTNPSDENSYTTVPIPCVPQSFADESFRRPKSKYSVAFYSPDGPGTVHIFKLIPIGCVLTFVRNKTSPAVFISKRVTSATAGTVQCQLALSKKKQHFIRIETSSGFRIFCSKFPENNYDCFMEPVYDVEYPEHFVYDLSVVEPNAIMQGALSRAAQFNFDYPLMATNLFLGISGFLDAFCNNYDREDIECFALSETPITIEDENIHEVQAQFNENPEKEGYKNTLASSYSNRAGPTFPFHRDHTMTVGELVDLYYSYARENTMLVYSFIEVTIYASISINSFDEVEITRRRFNEDLYDTVPIQCTSQNYVDPSFTELIQDYAFRFSPVEADFNTFNFKLMGGEFVLTFFNSLVAPKIFVSRLKNSHLSLTVSCASALTMTGQIYFRVKTDRGFRIFCPSVFELTFECFSEPEYGIHGVILLRQKFSLITDPTKTGYILRAISSLAKTKYVYSQFWSTIFSSKLGIAVDYCVWVSIKGMRCSESRTNLIWELVPIINNPNTNYVSTLPQPPSKHVDLEP